MGQTLKLKYFLLGLLVALVAGFFLFTSYYDSAHPAPFYVDLILHFIGGIFVTALFAYIFLANKITLSRRAFVNAILLVSFTTLIGVLWEFYEYEVANLFMVQQNPLDDTLSDILMDIIGGTAFVIFYRLKSLISDSR